MWPPLCTRRSTCLLVNTFGDDAIVHSLNPGVDTGYAFGELTAAYLAQWRSLARVP